MKLTVRKIAELAGASPASVSLVLNDKPGVGPELRQRITELLEENGYTIRRRQEEDSPKKILYLSYRDTENIPVIQNDLLPALAEGVERICRQKNYTLAIVNAERDTLDGLLDDAMTSGYDGIIFQGTEFKCRDYERYEKFPIPIVFVDHYIYGNAINTLNPDGRGSFYQPLAYLKELGHREIGFVTPVQDYGTFRDRENFFYQMMQMLDLPVEEEFIYHIDYFQEDRQAEFERILGARRRLPTAIVASNDLIAVPVFWALTKRGIRIPEDISLVGYGDSLVAKMISPQLTTVQVQMVRYGELAMEHLVRIMEGHSPDVLKISISTKLIVRGSTAEPRDNAVNWHNRSV